MRGHGEFAWTDERLARGKQMYFDGASAGEIAQAFGLSRNAVCGQVARRKWSRRPQPPKPAGILFRPLPQPREPDDLVAAAAKPIATAKFVAPRPAPHTDAITPRKTVTRLTNHGNRFDHVEVNEPTVVDLPDEHSECAVTLMELERHHCRWPDERPDAPMMYCGEVKLAEIDSPYCKRHSAMAFAKAKQPPQISEAVRAQRREHGRRMVASGKFA